MLGHNEMSSFGRGSGRETANQVTSHGAPTILPENFLSWESVNFFPAIPLLLGEWSKWLFLFRIP